MFDLIAASAALILLSPLFAVVALTVRLKLGSPVLFRQRRAGLHGEPFTLVKFRTMRDARAADGTPLADGERLSRFGRWLRATSLDELPELWNVVKGDMSLVGPRPLLMHYLPLYSPEQARRHAMKPGITGWVQIKGRNALGWDQKFALDTWYVDNWSLALDFRILAASIVSVLRPHGISAADSATMPEFTGSREQAAADAPPGERPAD